LPADYTPFDGEILIHINSVLANLNQLGIGPEGGMFITGVDETWSDFLVRVDELVPDPRLNHVKSYMTLRLKMIFDPPSVGYLVTSYEKMITEAEWRIMVAQDDVIHPRTLPTTVVYDEDASIEEVILDGGAP
jgi:hypothetical protein